MNYLKILLLLLHLYFYFQDQQIHLLLIIMVKKDTFQYKRTWFRNPFWASVEKGAKEEAQKLGVELILIAPPQEGDVQAQVNQLEDQIAKGVDAIALAPSDPNALAPIVDDAIKNKIPVVFVDTAGSNKGVTFIGTNNMNGAELAAKFICENAPKGSDVAILTGIESQSTALLRRDGAIKGFKDCGLNLVATQTAEWDTAKARSVTESILVKNQILKLSLDLMTIWLQGNSSYKRCWNEKCSCCWI